jgi:hypothetical protein
MAPTLDLEALVLKTGAHPAGSQEMCVMEAVAFIAGEPWSDSPQCVSPVIAAFLRSYNDSVSDEVRQSLKQYIPRLIGTRGSQELEDRRSLVAADWLVRIHTPAWLRLAGLTTQAEALESLPEITSFAQVPSIKGPLEAARQAGDAAVAAAWDAAGAAAWDAAVAAAGAAAWAAARAAAWDAAVAAAGAAAGDAAWDAAVAAAGAAAWDAAWDAAGAAAWDAAWDAARDAARAAAGDAAWDAAGAAAWATLRPTVEKLQATVPTLIEKLLSVEVQ